MFGMAPLISGFILQALPGSTRLRRWHWIGCGLGVAGLAVVFADSLTLGGGAQVLALAMMLSAVTLFSASGIAVQRVAAGLDPEGLVEFFQRLQGVPGSELSGAMTWLSTHPDHASRISHVREVAAAQPKTAPRLLESDWGALKVALGEAP